jgi:hypothetical protein
MHSLRELNDLLISKQIEIKEFGGWYLKVGKDTWTMAHDVLYRNGLPQSLKEKNLFDKYKKVTNDNQNIKTRKWRGISSRNYRGK